MFNRNVNLCTYVKSYLYHLCFDPHVSIKPTNVTLNNTFNHYFEMPLILEFEIFKCSPKAWTTTLPSIF